VTDASSNLIVLFEAASSATFAQACFDGDIVMRVIRGTTVMVRERMAPPQISLARILQIASPP